MSLDAASSSAVHVLRNWFVAARPSSDHALAQVDEARARGLITREEYLDLLDAWPDEAA